MDIISLPIQGDFVNTHSRYRLVGMATQRARHLMDGNKSTVPTKYVKPTTIAIAEVLGGNFEILYGKEALKCQQEARRAREERRTRFLSPEREEELKREIEKDLNLFMAESPTKGDKVEAEKAEEPSI
ncbi:MAG: DNA-directed RNA polymerase subunit omega [Nitrospirota bacterium]